MTDFNFTPGRRYRIVHKSSTQRVARVSVMDYLGSSGAIDSLGFSARPIAGTQTLPRSWIIEAEEVPKNTPVSLNRKMK